MQRVLRASSVIAVVASGLTAVFACGTSSTPGQPAETGDGGGLCLENTCRSDDHCAGCSGGRTTCDSTQRRCIACGPGAGQCPQGQYCTQFGDCVPNGVTCQRDTRGNPAVVCNTAADCAACDPHHQVCDVALHQCVGCMPSDVTKCLPSEACIQDTCVPRCPATCKTNLDCGQCGAPGHEAHACNAGRCAECGPNVPCKNGERCTPKGTCEKPCGIVGKARGTCASDQDCSGCEAGAVSCHLPVNGGDGRCGPTAPGCDQLGPGLSLPDPWNRVTNLCSTDNDCSAVSVDFNVGKALRDVTGISSIHDAVIPYGMHACASVQILPDRSCGVCVPCKKDSDCAPINVDQVAAQAFGPNGAIATSLLIDEVFATSDHNVHMYCNLVVSDYGYCTPCPNFFAECGQDTPPAPTCDHTECDYGAALAPACNTCVGEVCASDPYCCDAQEGAWDDTCIDAVAQACGKSCR